MSNRSIQEYLNLHRQSYRVASWSDKQRIINEVCRNLRWHRKSVIRSLNRPLWAGEKVKKNRGKKYSWQAEEHLKKLWLKMEQMCSKKLVQALPNWLPHYSECNEEVKKELLQMSASTIDRYLRRYRAIEQRRLRSGTKPGSKYFKNRIPIKPLDHNVTSVGTVEADTVAHCGDSMSGVFAWSLTITDVKTGWTENAAMWGKSGKGVVQGIKDSERNMPFTINEFCCDNGSEFLNTQLLLYFSNLSKKKKKDIIKRGRPYRKNDQCHVEQKNNTHVRQLLGYSRIDNKEAVDLINDLYLNYWSKLQNFFVPQMKLLRKTRVGAKYKREYTKPMTPYERVLLEPSIPQEVKHRLTQEYKALNPFELQKQIESKLKIIFNLQKASPRKEVA